jgi:hypothetical protein
MEGIARFSLLIGRSPEKIMYETNHIDYKIHRKFCYYDPKFGRDLHIVMENKFSNYSFQLF